MRYTVVRYVGRLVPLNFRRAALAMSREVALQQVQAEELTLLEADNKTSYFGVWFTTEVDLPYSPGRATATASSSGRGCGDGGGAALALAQAAVAAE